MPEPEDLPLKPPPPAATPALPDVESPPRDDVLDGVPSPEEIVKQAQTAEAIVDEQPSVDDLLRRRP